MYRILKYIRICYKEFLNPCKFEHYIYIVYLIFLSVSPALFASFANSGPPPKKKRWKWKGQAIFLRLNMC